MPGQTRQPEVKADTEMKPFTRPPLAVSDPLAYLASPVDPRYVGKLPKITCRDCGDKNNSAKVCNKHEKKDCPVCHNWITTAHMHIDFYGHAETTRRLLEADPDWNWRPMAFEANGLPLIDADGGLWIYLTIHDQKGDVHERIGYGEAAGMQQRGAEGTKVIIGDALKNAAMRFGVALELWSKERDLESAGDAVTAPPAGPPRTSERAKPNQAARANTEAAPEATDAPAEAPVSDDDIAKVRADIAAAVDLQALVKIGNAVTGNKRIAPELRKELTEVFKARMAAIKAMPKPEPAP